MAKNNDDKDNLDYSAYLKIKIRDFLFQMNLRKTGLLLGETHMRNYQNSLRALKTLTGFIMILNTSIKFDV